MKSLVDSRKKVLIGSFISWLLPLFVSFFLVNPETKEYLINFWLFKILMASLLGVVVFYLFSNLKKTHQLKIQTAHTFFLFNFLADLVVLIGLFKMDLYSWISTIVTIYLLVIYGIYYYFSHQ